MGVEEDVGLELSSQPRQKRNGSRGSMRLIMKI